MNDSLITYLSDLKKEDALRVASERLEAGEDPLRIMEDGKKGMKIVGDRFEDGTYFIPDLVYSGKILERVSEMVKPRLLEVAAEKRPGKFIIGSVAGDLHDIGKNLVVFMLDVNGYEVYDLGVDVSPRAFVEKIREVNAEIVGLSGFLTSVYQSMKDTVDAIEEAGLKEKVKIMIGGGVIDEEVRRFCGADAYGPDAMAAVNLAREWTGGE
jgi:methanogenic corrinoid protein MtbC1